MEVNKGLTEEQLEEYKQWFNQFEVDERISLEDLLQVMIQLKLSITDSEYKAYKKRIELDLQSRITLTQFLNILARKTLQTEIEDEIRQLYKMFDVNNNGYISAFELKNVLVGLNPRITDQQVDLIMMEADKDHDGFLSYQEFVYLCMPR